MSYETVRIVYTRGDSFTLPGGIILRKAVDRFGPGKHQYIAHDFSRERGSREPTSFFWGHYSDSLTKGKADFQKKYERMAQYTTGGSIIPGHLLEEELAKELEASDATA